MNDYAPTERSVKRWGSLEERLLAKRQITADGCWEWTGGKWSTGYGLLHTRNYPRLVHRLAYELWVGPIPDGLQIDHLCRNRACFNPGHLEPVTLRENNLRGEGRAAVNARKTHCSRHGHPLSGDNLSINPQGSRVCKACAAENMRRYRASKRGHRNP